MKKYIKTILVVTIMVLLCVGVFYYLDRRDKKQDATDKSATAQSISALTTKDLDKNYPESPKEVVKFYARIQKMYYRNELTDEQIEELGAQSRKLFDEELKATQSDSEFITALKKEIASYNEKNRYISDYTIDDSDVVTYKTFRGKEYAFLSVTYMIRENEHLTIQKTKFTLRKDDDKKWKILYWELE